MIRLALWASLALCLISVQPESYAVEGRILTPTHAIPRGLVVEVEGAVHQIPGPPIELNLDKPLPAVVCLKFGQELLLTAETRHHHPYSQDASLPFDAGLMRPGATVAITPTVPGQFCIYDSLHATEAIHVVVSERDTAMAFIGPDGHLKLEDLPPGTNCLNFRTVIGRPLYGQRTLVLPLKQGVDIVFP